MLARRSIGRLVCLRCAYGGFGRIPYHSTVRMTVSGMTVSGMTVSGMRVSGITVSGITVSGMTKP